jgi:hypothetical protein
MKWTRHLSQTASMSQTKKVVVVSILIKKKMEGLWERLAESVSIFPELFFSFTQLGAMGVWYGAGGYTGVSLSQQYKRFRHA